MTAAIEYETGQPRKPRLYMRIETEDFDDFVNSVIASSVAVAFRILRLTIENECKTKTKLEFKETEDAVTMIIRDHCLAATPFGHLHLRGKKGREKKANRIGQSTRFDYDFQLPLSGSPSPIPGFSGSPRLSAAAPLAQMIPKITIWRYRSAPL
jgi:hypothetical protein